MIDSFTGQYEFLSNFYPANICIDGTTYPTAEHAFQCMKCLYDDDRESVLACKTPADAKHLGRTVKMRPDWERIKVDVMHGILLQKFSDPKLAEMLLATGDEELIEGNQWNDKFWGVCRGAGCNMLGRLLMDVRDKMK